MKIPDYEVLTDHMGHVYVRYTGSFKFMGKQSARRFIDAVEEVAKAIDNGKNVEVKTS